MSNSSKIAYAIAFQLGWFICIMAGNTIGFFYTIIFVAAHFFYLKTALNRVLWFKESLWLLIVFIGGFLLETLTFSAGFLYSRTQPVLFDHLTLPPLWLLNLWLLFAVALRTCLTFVFTSPRITYYISAVAIPLNYYAGAQLNADVDVNHPYILSLALISLQWIFLLWCLIKIKNHCFEDIFNAR
jgi:hypothetical protein